MHVVIPKPLEAFVRRKVEEGRYATEVDVIADALRLMQARDEVAAMKHERLRNALARGYEDVAAGRVIEPDPFGALTPHLAPVRATDRCIAIAGNTSVRAGRYAISNGRSALRCPPGNGNGQRQHQPHQEAADLRTAIGLLQAELRFERIVTDWVHDSPPPSLHRTRTERTTHRRPTSRIERRMMWIERTGILYSPRGIGVNDDHVVRRARHPPRQAPITEPAPLVPTSVIEGRRPWP